MPDYSQGKIYSIRSYQTDKMYIGSTCQPLSKRLYDHKKRYKWYTQGKYNKYCSSYKILQYEDHYIELIKEYPCDCKEKLIKKEGKYIRRYLKKGRCVNRNIACRTKKEWVQDNKEKLSEYHKQYSQKNKEDLKQYKKQYREDNKEKIKKREKQYREINKDKIKQRKAVKITCDCGSTVRRNDYARHKKSKKHKKWEENNK